MAEQSHASVQNRSGWNMNDGGKAERFAGCAQLASKYTGIEIELPVGAARPEGEQRIEVRLLRRSGSRSLGSKYQSRKKQDEKFHETIIHRVVRTATA